MQRFSFAFNKVNRLQALSVKWDIVEEVREFKLNFTLKIKTKNKNK
jgi:hypothetical protein